MSPERRGCYYPDERHLDTSDGYTRENCVLECGWKRAASACACVPWFLKGHFPDQSVCEIFGNECFREVVDKKDESCNADCLADCDTYIMEANDLGGSERKDWKESSFRQIYWPGDIDERCLVWLADGGNITLPKHYEMACAYVAKKLNLQPGVVKKERLLQM